MQFELSAINRNIFCHASIHEHIITNPSTFSPHYLVQQTKYFKHRSQLHISSSILLSSNYSISLYPRTQTRAQVPN